MALITLSELWSMIIISLVLGYIFMVPLKKAYGVATGFSWDDFLFAVMITAPAIILHELAHKFTALLFGFVAVFKASYFGLALGVFLKLMSSPLILFAPGYVEFSGGTPLQNALVAFAGPFMNLLLFLLAKIVLRRSNLQRKTWKMFYLTQQINLFLFIFNMLPIPPLDGSKFFFGLFKVLTSLK